MASFRELLFCFILNILCSKNFAKPVNNNSLKILNKGLLPQDHIPAVKLERDGHINPDFHHEAFLGRMVEEGKLNPSNLDGSKKLIEIFHKVDVNKNHKVDRQELTEWIHSRITEHYEHAMKLNKDHFTNVDKNSDGILTLREYMQGLTGDDKTEKEALKLEEQSEEELKGLMEEIMPQELTRWNRADKNKDSSLSEDEFLSFQHPEHNEQSIESMAEDLMSQMDDNTDQMLTMDEFVRIPPGEVDPEDKEEDDKYFNERRSEFSDQMDIDKDKKVSIAELVQYLDPRHKQHAVKEADYLMSISDRDRDGELNESEMIANYKLFTGSSMADSPRIFHEEF